MLTIDQVFQFLILEKILFAFMVNYCNQELRFLGLAKSL